MVKIEIKSRIKIYLFLMTKIVPFENLQMIRKLKDFRKELDQLLEHNPLSQEELSIILKEIKSIEKDINDLREEKL